MKLKAIIIDDEPFVRDDLRAMLAAHETIEVRKVTQQDLLNSIDLMRYLMPLHVC